MRPSQFKSQSSAGNQGNDGGALGKLGQGNDGGASGKLGLGNDDGGIR